MFNSILSFLKEIWAKIKRIFVAIINLTKNIVNWFKGKYAEIIRKHPNVKPITLKIEKELVSGNYNTMDIGLNSEYAVVNTFYDESTQSIIEDETEIIESNQLDEETMQAFGDKEMLVLS